MTTEELLAELDRPAVQLRVAAEILGIGKSHAYQLAARVTAETGRGDLVEGVPVFRIGSRYSVPSAALRAVLQLDRPAVVEPPSTPSIVDGFSEERLDRLLDALLVELLARRLPAAMAEGRI
ncbi:hypothetical protein ACXYTP_17710 [Tsukamurella ocularis]